MIDGPIVELIEISHIMWKEESGRVNYPSFDQKAKKRRDQNLIISLEGKPW